MASVCLAQVIKCVACAVSLLQNPTLLLGGTSNFLLPISLFCVVQGFLAFQSWGSPFPFLSKLPGCCTTSNSWGQLEKRQLWAVLVLVLLLLLRTQEAVVKLERIALTSLHFFQHREESRHTTDPGKRLLGCLSEVTFATERTWHFRLKLGFSRNWVSGWRNVHELTQLTVPTSRVLICRL